MQVAQLQVLQLAFIILCLLYTFSRTECPCPKAFSGREVYDPEVHWNVCDFDVAITALVRVLRIRFRVIKQDQRVERPESPGPDAQGTSGSTRVTTIWGGLLLRARGGGTIGLCIVTQSHVIVS